MGTANQAKRSADAPTSPPAPAGSEIEQIARALHAGREIVVTPEGRLQPAETGLGQRARALHWFAGKPPVKRRARQQAARSYRIFIPIDQLRAIEAEAKRPPAGFETGGALIGVRSGPFEFVVAVATGPGGSNATHEPARFTADPEHVQAMLDPHLASGKSLIGAWHLHPVGPDVPSDGDVATMRAEIATEGAHPFFVQIIAVNDEQGVRLNAFVLERGRLIQATIVRRAADDHFSRLNGVVNVGVLQSKTVLVAGLGSGGSMMTVTMAQAGVGGFLVLDDDVLTDANVVRHACDIRHVGTNKAEAVAELVRNRNPNVAVVALAERLGHDEKRALELMALADLIVCAADDESSRRAISRLARQARKPLLVPGAYAGAVGGDVIFVNGSAGPCYVCSLTKIVGGAVDPQDIHEETKNDYGTASAGLAPQSGLGADIQLIATLAAKWAIRLLDPSPAEGHWEGLNFLVWGNRDGMDLRALTVVEWGRIERDPDCDGCSTPAELEARTGRTATTIREEVQRLISGATQRGDGLSTAMGGR